MKRSLEIIWNGNSTLDGKMKPQHKVWLDRFGRITMPIWIAPAIVGVGLVWVLAQVFIVFPYWIWTGKEL